MKNIKIKLYAYEVQGRKELHGIVEPLFGISLIWFEDL